MIIHEEKPLHCQPSFLDRSSSCSWDTSASILEVLHTTDDHKRMKYSSLKVMAILGTGKEYTNNISHVDGKDEVSSLSSFMFFSFKAEARFNLFLIIKPRRNQQNFNEHTKQVLNSKILNCLVFICGRKQTVECEERTEKNKDNAHFGSAVRISFLSPTTESQWLMI